MPSFIEGLAKGFKERRKERLEREPKPIDLMRLLLEHQQIVSKKETDALQNKRLEQEIAQHERESEPVPFGQLPEALRSLGPIVRGDLPRFYGTAQAAETATENRAERARIEKDRSMERFIKGFNINPKVVKQSNSVAFARTILDIQDIHNPLADATLPTFLSRATTEVGNLSFHDKEPFGGSRALGQKVARELEFAKSGNLHKVDRQFVVQLAQTLELSANKNLDYFAQEFSKQRSASSKGHVEAKELFEILRPGSFDLLSLEERFKKLEEKRNR